MLTACGIETRPIVSVSDSIDLSCNSAYRLRYWNCTRYSIISNYIVKLQQCLPLAVLKQHKISRYFVIFRCCNSAYRLRYWNRKARAFFTSSLRLQQCLPLAVLKPHFARLKLLGSLRCNSAYRLRYWNKAFSITAPTLFAVATVLTACGIETSRHVHP